VIAANILASAATADAFKPPSTDLRSKATDVKSHYIGDIS
jgi:hypothetical protein